MMQNGSPTPMKLVKSWFINLLGLKLDGSMCGTINSTVKSFTALVKELLLSHLHEHILRGFDSVAFGRACVNTLITAANATTVSAQKCIFLDSSGLNTVMPLSLSRFTFCCK